MPAFQWGGKDLSCVAEVGLCGQVQVEYRSGVVCIRVRLLARGEEVTKGEPAFSPDCDRHELENTRLPDVQARAGDWRVCDGEVRRLTCDSASPPALSPADRPNVAAVVAPPTVEVNIAENFRPCMGVICFMILQQTRRGRDWSATREVPVMGLRETREEEHNAT